MAIVGGRTNGVIHMHAVQQVLVYEKISDSEGRALSQSMLDTHVAQKALTGEKAAA